MKHVRKANGVLPNPDMQGTVAGSARAIDSNFSGTQPFQTEDKECLVPSSLPRFEP
jgi:hypothetical protein